MYDVDWAVVAELEEYMALDTCDTYAAIAVLSRNEVGLVFE
jgi:hypothetical protein